MKVPGSGLSVPRPTRARAANLGPRALDLFGVSGPVSPHRAWNQQAHRRSTGTARNPGKELSFLGGGGYFRELLAKRGRWYEGSGPPGVRPRLPQQPWVLGADVLAVHGIWLSEADREILARRSNTVVLCPRSNRFTGAGFPDLPELVKAGVPLPWGPTPWPATGTWSISFQGNAVPASAFYPDFPICEGSSPSAP